jgi:hypothetical protein
MRARISRARVVIGVVKETFAEKYAAARKADRISHASHKREGDKRNPQPVRARVTVRVREEDRPEMKYARANRQRTRGASFPVSQATASKSAVPWKTNRKPRIVTGM